MRDQTVLIMLIALTLALLTLAEAQTNCADEGFSVDISISLSGSAPLPVASIVSSLGLPLDLSCAVVITGTNPPPVTSHTWYHRGQIISETSAILNVASASGSDGGEYMCQAQTTTCTTQTSPIFTVNTVPDMVVLEPLNNITRTEGDSFSLNCRATGWPVPTVQWELTNAGGSRVVGGDGEYSVESAKLSHAGIYTCRATNDLGVVVMNRTVSITALPSTSNMNYNDETTVPEAIERSNGTIIDFERVGFYIAIAVTSGVGLILGISTLLCCMMTVYMNSCYSRPVKPHDPYDDWPDGGEGQVQDMMPKVIVDQNESAFGGGGESLKVPAEHWVTEPEDEPEIEPEVEPEALAQPDEQAADEEEMRLAASPSEVGEIV